MNKKMVVGLIAGVFMLCIAGMATADTLVSQGLGSSAYTASSSWNSTHSPDLAFDGILNTGWNAGDWPVAWIEVNLGQLYDVTSLRLIIAQNPSPADTTHQVWMSSQSILENTSNATLAHTFIGATSSWDELFISFSTPITAQYLQIKTISSPSWVAWNEIQVMAASVPEPASMLLLGLGLISLVGIKRKLED